MVSDSVQRECRKTWIRRWYCEKALLRFEQIIQACKLAEIHSTIEALPEGYQTQIGEHGAGLSGGQKQRLAIARALLKRPKILIFDEATSHLDMQTAEAFATTINKLKGKVTMLFIAHQLPKGLLVDEVVRLNKPAAAQASRNIEVRRATEQWESNERDSNSLAPL